MEGTFIHGKREGLWVIWDKQGHKLSESTYKDDKLNGSFLRWNAKENKNLKGVM